MAEKATIKETLLTFPLYIITHPFKGFDDMKFMRKGSFIYAAFALVLLGFVQVFSVTNMGFIVTGFWTETPHVNVILTFTFAWAPILLFCVANWSVTTITGGKGSFREIFLTFTYCLYPLIICTLIGVFLSNIVTAGEMGFATGFIRAGVFLQYMYLFVGLIVIHEYGLLRAILMVVLTVLAMLIITFVLALMFMLFNNVIGFFIIFFRELSQHWL